MKHFVFCAAMALTSLSICAQDSGSGSGSGSSSSGWSGLLVGAVQLVAPGEFSLIDAPPGLDDYQGHSFQSVTFALTPSGNQDYSFDLQYILPDAFKVGLLHASAWFEPALAGQNYITVTAPSASISVDPAFVLGGTILQSAIVPIAPNMQTPIKVAISGYQAGIAGACISGTPHCIYLTDPGVLKVKFEASVGPVPEPSTHVLMGLGLAGLGFIAHQRRRSHV